MCLAAPVHGQIEKKRVLLLPANKRIENYSQIRHIIQAGVKTVEIDTEEGIDTTKNLLQQQKWEEIAKYSKNAGAAEAIISRHITKFITSVTDSISKSVTSRNLIKDGMVSNLVKDIMLFIENNVDILLALVRLRGMTEHTFSHSINTMILSISVATTFKLNYTDIKRFGTATLLADLGMTNYPSRLIQRQSGLTKKEIDEIKKHPLYTVNFLKKNGISDPLIETVIIQHHERFDGTGYPKGLNGDQIHPIAKLFSIADVYDAMTSQRPHRQGIPPHLVLAEILSMSGTLFDPKISKLFIKHMGVFPVGNMVELTNGHYGLVASQNPEKPLRPQVVILMTKKKNPNFTKKDDDEPGIIVTRGKWELIDLAVDSSFGKIKRGLDHRKYRINPDYYLSQI